MTQDIESKIEKLLRLAADRSNEHESLAAMEMAQKLADAHNLDIGVIGKTGSRRDERVNKGLYVHQRNLYAGLAQMNHCRCWLERGLTKGTSYRIRLLGSKLNVAVVKNMAEYFEQATDRMVSERIGVGSKFFSKEANAYRIGMVDTLLHRVAKRRKEEEAERARAKREQEMRSRHPGAAVENAVVLVSDVKAEEDRANYDYLHGDGAWDALQARIAENVARAKRANEELAKWREDNPGLAAAADAEQAKLNDEWRKKQAKLDKRREQARARRGNPETPRKKTVYDSDSYWEGRKDADEVGLDEQLSATRNGRLTS